MLDICGIDAAAVRQHPSFLFHIEGYLIAVIDGLIRLRVPIGQAVQESVLFQGRADNFRHIHRIDFLILDPQRFDCDDRRLCAESVTSRGSDFDPIRHPLPFNLFQECVPDLGGPIRSAAGHTDMYLGPACRSPGKNLVPEPLQLPDGCELFHLT